MKLTQNHKLAFMALIIFGFLVHLFYFEWDAASGNLKDFEVYYTAGKKALQGLTVYDVQGHWQFKYAPVIAQYFAFSFSSLDFETSRLLYYGFNAFLWMFWLSLIVYKSTHRWEEQITLAFFSLLFFGKAILRDSDLGQANTFALILSGLAFHFFAKRFRLASFWGSLCLAIAIQFKLYICLAFPILLFKRKFDAIALTSVLFLLTSFLPLWGLWGYEFALSEHIRWLTTLTSSSDVLLGSMYNISTIGIFSKWIAWKELNLVLWALTVFVFLYYTWLHRTMAWKKHYAWMLAGVVLLNPLSWVYWIAFMIPLFCQVYLSTRTVSTKTKTAFAVPAWIAWFGLDISFLLQGIITLANGFLAFVFLKRSAR